jgi:hypothetical protein
VSRPALLFERRHGFLEPLAQLDHFRRCSRLLRLRLRLRDNGGEQPVARAVGLQSLDQP